MRLGILLSLFLIGCAKNTNDKCGNKILAVANVAPGQYQLQELTLPTLNSPYTLSGPPAKIYYKSGVDDNGFTGAPAQPNYTRAGDTCVPMDTQSSMAVSLYAQFEKIWQFEQKLGIISWLTWPRRVGLDINITTSEGAIHNNAHYFGAWDSIAVQPYGIRGVPLGLNPGVLGHEHFHAHFQRQVLTHVTLRVPSLLIESLFYPGFGAKPMPDDIERVDFRKPRGLNAFVLRGWNEGLADVYGAIYSGNPRFFDESLPQFKEQRALTAQILPLISAGGIKDFAQRSTKRGLSNLAYDEGAKVARVLYRIAMSGVEPPEQFLVRLLNRLKEIPDQIVPTFETEVMEFERVLEILLRDFPRTASVCQTVRAAVSDAALQRSFAQCSGI